MAQTSTEDIDILHLLERGILFFKKFRWIFLSALLAGIFTGWFFYKKLVPTTYRSKLVLHSFILTNPEQIQIVNNWNDQLHQKEYTDLSAAMNCKEGILKKIKSFKAKEIQQAFTPSNPNGFTIEVVVTDNRILDSLQKAIISGFENGSYIKERLAIKRASLTELIDKTAAGIQRLDSLKNTMEAIMGGSGRTPSSVIIDGSSSISTQLIELNEKLLTYKENLQFTSAVQVLQGFSKFNQPDGPKLLPWLAIGIFSFLTLAWVWAVISNINQKLKQRKQ